MSSNNPFAALIVNKVEKGQTNINTILEKIFGFTVNPAYQASSELLYLEDVRSVHGKDKLDVDLIQYALFERLFMCNDNSSLRNILNNSAAFETSVIKYLFNCIKNLGSFKSKLKPEEEVEIRKRIIQNVATAIIQPDIYSGQDLPADFIRILKDAEPESSSFLIESSAQIILDDNGNNESLAKFIDSMNKIITDELNKSSITSFDLSVFNYLQAMTADEVVGNLFITSCTPKTSIGSHFVYNPIGALLNLSILPKTPTGPYEHFSEPMDPVTNSSTETYLWNYLNKLNQNLHQIILAMLKCSPTMKDKTLTWLGDCLQKNSNRGKIWNMQVPELNPAIYTNVTDGFILNLCNLILSLCQPFCAKIQDGKILKVDPTYCAVPNEKADEKSVHLKDLSKETCLLPTVNSENNEDERLVAESYSFLTECFYMAHRAVDLGYTVAVDKLTRQNHEIGRMERAFNDALQQVGGNSDLVGTIKDRMRDELSKYLSLKCVLSNPDLLQKVFDLVSATGYWLCQVPLYNDFTNSATYAPLKEKNLEFPISESVPDTLKCIPEFIIENMVSYLIFLRRFSSKTFEEQGYEKLSPLLSFILIYMGSQSHLRNPHIRAKLAEGLESLLPFQRDEPMMGNTLGGSQRQKLFIEHPHRLNVVHSLMEVFVGIEMTGQSVEFEQKFNYRRPMYLVFDYLWELPEHRNCFLLLAQEAEKNMDAMNPPLFLRFVNLLINDAIFLLDESLTNMSKLREMQQAQDNGEWNNLSAQERTQNISYMHHIGNMAKFDNILGKDTIGTLQKLTSKIVIVFTHSTMVDRIAAMLNYFLLNLVGPNKKNFKVKDAKEYQFDPAGTVLEICKIYVNLKDSDDFCLAVSQDGRSYSSNLFDLAEDVLVRIGGGTLIGELKEAADKIAQKAKEHKANEEALAEAPDHFLDPIMSALMTDPVILPSSKQTVDRSTIARHLLSDQTDPFNRSPLSMDQVIPNTELAEEINRWIAERKTK